MPFSSLHKYQRTEFQQMSLNRLSLAGLTGGTASDKDLKEKPQKVENPTQDEILKQMLALEEEKKQRDKEYQEFVGMTE